MKAMSRIITSGIILAMTASVVGCANNESNSEGNTTNKTITLKVSSHMSTEDRIKFMDETIKIFNKKHPDVKINYTPSAQDYGKNLKLSFSSGEGDDIVYVDDINQQMLQENNYLMDLTEAVTSNNWLEMQTPGSIEFNNIRTPGQYFSVPFLMAPVVIYYNKAIFNELDLSVPSNIEEFEHILEETKAAGYIPMENGGISNYNLMWTVYSLLYGLTDMEDVNSFYYQKGPTPAFEEAMVASLKKVDEWVEKGYYRKEMASIDGDALMPLYSQGKSAMMLDGDWNLPSYTKMEFDVGVFPFPQMNPDLPHTIVNATDSAWALNAKLADQPEKKQAALDFIAIFMDPEVVKIWSEGGLTSSVLHDESSYNLHPIKKELNQVVKGTQIGFYLDNAVPGILDVISKETQRMMLNEITPEDTWNHIHKEYERLVSQQTTNK
jgi:raffinose/stachyose/melibiose transport system substrate-binding protein